MDELSYDGAHGGDQQNVSDKLTRMLEEETRRIQNDTSKREQLLQDETILLGDAATQADVAGDDDYDDILSELGDVSAAPTKPKSGPAHLAPKGTDATVLLDEPLQVGFQEPDPDEPMAPLAGETELIETDVDADFVPTVVVTSQDADLDEVVPQVDPVEATLLRPTPRQEPEDEPLLVRNTRDYDHDAQSVNVVAGAENFATIVDDSSRREVRRDPYARSRRKGRVPGEGNSQSRLRPLLAICIIMLVFCGGGAVLTYGMEMWGGKSVPYVVGESQENAEARIAEKGLTIEVVAEPADDAIGKVLSQDPDSGVRIPEGGKVTLVVATNRTMPKVKGMSQEEAEKALRAVGVEHIEIKTKPSRKVEGLVLRQRPKAGAAFNSRSTVTLVVATHYTVPDVVGKKENDAVDIIKAEGLNPEVTYVNSKQTVRTVVSTSPMPGEIIDQGGTVRVEVSSPYPTDIHHLAEFFSHSSQDVDTYLLSKNFAFERGAIDNLGNAVQTYTSSDQGNYTFSSQPYVRGLKLPSEGSTNVLSTGAPIAGVRLDCPSSMIPEGLDRAAVIKMARACGFKGLLGTVTNDNMGPGAGAAPISAKFVCGSGEMGDLLWSVLIINNGGSRRAVATCAKKNLYSSSDLQPYGGSLHRFMAYQEVYLSGEYQVKEEKKDDKQDGNTGTGEDGRSDDDAAADARAAEAYNDEQH